MSDDGSYAPETAEFRFASELFEDRIAREYGEQYTQAKIDEDIEALESALNQQRSAYFFAGLPKYGAVGYWFPTINQPVTTYPQLLRQRMNTSAEARRGLSLPTYESLNQTTADNVREAAITSQVFFSLN